MSETITTVNGIKKEEKFSIPYIEDKELAESYLALKSAIPAKAEESEKDKKKKITPSNILTNSEKLREDLLRVIKASADDLYIFLYTFDVLKYYAEAVMKPHEVNTLLEKEAKLSELRNRMADKIAQFGVAVLDGQIKNSVDFWNLVPIIGFNTQSNDSSYDWKDAVRLFGIDEGRSGRILYMNYTIPQLMDKGLDYVLSNKYQGLDPKAITKLYFAKKRNLFSTVNLDPLFKQYCPEQHIGCLSSKPLDPENEKDRDVIDTQLSMRFTVQTEKEKTVESKHIGNPCILRLPQKKQSKPRGLNEDQKRAVIQYVQAHDIMSLANVYYCITKDLVLRNGIGYNPAKDRVYTLKKDRLPVNSQYHKKDKNSKEQE